MTNRVGWGGNGGGLYIELTGIKSPPSFHIKIKRKPKRSQLGFFYIGYIHNILFIKRSILFCDIFKHSYYHFHTMKFFHIEKFKFYLKFVLKIKSIYIQRHL